MDATREQAVVLRYITGRDPAPKALQILNTISLQPLHGKEQRAWTACIRFPFIFSCIDGAYAMKKPRSAFRTRIHIYFAVAESIPAYSDLFLPAKRSFFYIIPIGFRGIWSFIKNLLGMFLLLFI